MFAKEAFDKLIKDHKFSTVLDIGSGGGKQAKAFLDAGKHVTAIDMGSSVYYQAGEANYKNLTLVKSKFENFSSDKKFDCVWASHILEHQRDPGIFLERCLYYLAEDGVLVVTVPPLKHNIVGGHVTLWNAGLLLYHLILAGQDCKKAAVKEYGYNISVIVKKASVPEDVLSSLHMDTGDIVRLQNYFPVPVKEGFVGNGISANW